MKDKVLHFKTNVQLKSIIGKDLINDDNIAILELVKNSFDANAKKVTVSYINQKDNDDSFTEKFTAKTSRLLIQDDGIGMNIDDIQNKWLNIAYSGKKVKQNQFNRRMAGAKGVGRFSCDRLGEHLNLYTKTKEEVNYTKLTINWKDFEVVDAEKEIQTIPLEYKILTAEQFEKLGFKQFEHGQGLLLEIIKLRSKWSYVYKDRSNIEYWSVEKYIDLKKYLEKLINPNHAFEVNDFGVYIKAPEFSKENNLLDENRRFLGKVENRIFDKLEFKSTSIEYKAINGGKETLTTLKDKGETVYWVKEVNPYYPYIKNVNLTLFYLNSYAKAFFTRQTGVQSVNYGSVFLFINGFRIPPYGDVGNDWLALDQRKAQGTRRYLGTRDIIGQIEIDDNTNDFQIISSREGIVNNDYFKRLTNSEKNDSFFYRAHRRIERFVVEGLNWDSSIYDSQGEEASMWKEIESKIISGDIQENELEYREDDKTKNERIYSSIHSLISAKPSEVIELYVNENLILDKIQEERIHTEREFNKILDDFQNKKIDEEVLSRLLDKRIKDNINLQKQIKEFSKFNTSSETSEALKQLYSYQAEIEDQANLITQLKEELRSLLAEKKDATNQINLYKEIIEKKERERAFEEFGRLKAEERIKEESEKNENLTYKLNFEKKKNEYLSGTRKTLSEDADQLIHTIDLYIRNAKIFIDNLILNHSFQKDVVEQLYDIKDSIDKSIKVSELILKSNFDLKIINQRIDLTVYIKEYIATNIIAKNKLSFDVQGSVSRHYSISPLDLEIVLDNLISNSQKARASNILIEILEENDQQLAIYFHDDGDGVSDRLSKNSELMFDLGARDSQATGSGIGLFDVKKRVENMKGQISFLGNGLKYKGATFKIII